MNWRSVCYILWVHFLDFSLIFSLPPCSGSGSFCSHSADRSPVSEQDASEAEKAQNLLFQSPDLRAGEALSPAEVSGQRRAGGSGQEPEDDRRAGQNLVSEPQNQVEVSRKLETALKLFCLKCVTLIFACFSIFIKY